MQHPTDACPWNASGAEETGRVAKQGASHRCGTQVTPRREAPAGDRDTCRRDAEGAITPYRAKGVPTRPMWPRRGLTEEGEAVRRGGENSVMLPRSAPNQHTCPASGCEQRIGRTRVGCFRQVLRSGYNPAEAWMLRMTLVSHGKINEVLALVK